MRYLNNDAHAAFIGGEDIGGAGWKRLIQYS
jgi:hypothetical protein